MDIPKLIILILSFIYNYSIKESLDIIFSITEWETQNFSSFSVYTSSVFVNTTCIYKNISFVYINISCIYRL